MGHPVPAWIQTDMSYWYPYRYDQVKVYRYRYQFDHIGQSQVLTFQKENKQVNQPSQIFCFVSLKYLLHDFYFYFNLKYNEIDNLLEKL